jgi:hypothetical protein
MKCRDFPKFYSAQLDGQASVHERDSLQQHLSACLVCRRRAAEMRSLLSDLRSLAATEPAPELAGQIQMALRQKPARDGAPGFSLENLKYRLAGLTGDWKLEELRREWFNSFANWFDGRRAKIFSQSVGAVVSLSLFVVVATEVFKQAYRTLSLATAATQVIFEDPEDDVLRHQALLKAALLPSPPPPLLTPNDEFRGAVASLEEGDVIFTAEIRRDGRATIIYILPPNDPSVKAKLSTAMSQRGIFKDAGPSRYTNPVAVVYLSSMTISGASSI